MATVTHTYGQLTITFNGNQITVPYDYEAMIVQYGKSLLLRKLQLYARIISRTCTSEDIKEIEEERFFGDRNPKNTGYELYLGWLMTGMPYLEWNKVTNNIMIRQYAEFGRDRQTLMQIDLTQEMSKELVPWLFNLYKLIK